MERLEEVPGLKMLGPTADKKGGVASFTFEGVHPHDVAQVLDRSGIAVRAGHHCAQPLHERLGVHASTRASFYLYSTSKKSMPLSMDSTRSGRSSADLQALGRAHTSLT